MNWNEIIKKSGIHDNLGMDKYLTSLGFNKDSVYYLTNPCQIHDYHLLNDVMETAQAIKEDINQNKKIIIIGDYDCDGVCSTTELYLTLDFCNACVDYIIPHRITDGYGMSKNLVDKVIEMNGDIILTCDNGIAAIEAVDYAKSKGLKVYITDHHTPGTILPNADFIVHPALGSYPFAFISGAQTAYKLSLAILEICSPTKKRRLKKGNAEQDLKDYLFQLATLTIVSDVMPIASPDLQLGKNNENRKWLIDGLNSIKENPNWRIKIMIDMLGLIQQNLEEQSIGFYIAPCINAVGRLTTAEKAVQFLTAQTSAEAQKKFSFMMYINEERKRVKAEAMEKVTLDQLAPANIVILDNLHEGVLGIIASACSNETNKTSIVLTNCEIVDDKKVTKKAWKGSARGTGEVNLYDILTKVQTQSNSIYAFGGHAGAAGITILDENIKTFEKEFESLMSEELKLSTFKKDYVQLTGREERIAFSEAVKNLKPFGNGLALPIVEISYNLACANLYYKSNHVKTIQFEMEKLPNGSTKYPILELWMFGGLEKVKPLLDNRYTMSDNVEKKRDEGLSEDEARAQRYEEYKIIKGNKARVTYKIEVGYSDFNGLGPRYNVKEVVACTK